MRDVVAAALVVLAASLALVAGVGLHRFPDVLSRMHAATKPATLGVLLLLIALVVRNATPAVVVKVVLIAALQFLTAPTGAHMVGRSVAQAGGGPPSDPGHDPSP